MDRGSGAAHGAGPGFGELRRHWRVLPPCMIGITLCSTHGYSLGVMIPVLERELGWARAETSMGLMIISMIALVGAPVVGLAIDRFPALRDCFDVVVAYEDTERHKPDPEPVLAALEKLQATPAEAAYVGDSPFDVRAAKAAGVFAVAVGWGGIHSDERLLDEEPDAFVATTAELLDVL